MADELGSGCFIGVTAIANSQGMYILGDTFLRNFITTFDYKANTISFGVNPDAPAGVTAVKKANVTEIMMIIGSIAFVFALGLFLYVQKKRR